jgi:hypothetical protein
MTPNIEKLFKYKKLKGIEQELSNCSTYFKRKYLFEKYGGDLLEALFNCIQDNKLLLDGLECDHDVNICCCGERRDYMIAKELLEKIEKEAGEE